MSPASLAGRTLLISGGSRGIGLAIARRATADGANVALLAKTADPHPALDGTVFTAADEIRDAGGRALPIVGDVRNEDDVREAVSRCVEEFGGIDIVVNNASAINLGGSAAIEMKRFDLMHDINTRGTFLLTRTALPHLQASEDARILTLSPPLNLDPRWLGAYPAYMLAKYGMTLATLGIGAETGITAGCLWPRTTIQTAAVLNILGGEEVYRRSRTVELYSDAAHAVLVGEAAAMAGQTLLCEDVLRDAGVTDFAKYSPGVAESELYPDAFVD
ncbi:NAD(P)-dependent oxidoreductase [Gulosibacter macacae]|uniref:NAD(P)-dependent oxidoreductase n=1 Tax=Gulosibacter macacae TaxID=2488791 RepID=A0A3P3W286_9MICO|nr:NAD(P)-dependent oxidoreductase [Gulosibacter macacae]RRJ86933.1 NAD(P)-dependent oxidoreductase [Gulosibacter macacae]